MENLTHDVECVSDALSDMDEKVKSLLGLVDAASAQAESLTSGMHAMTRDECFDGVMNLWRTLTKIGSSAIWIDVHTRTARHHASYLLEEAMKEKA
jgi:hypothetical protein